MKDLILLSLLCCTLPTLAQTPEVAKPNKKAVIVANFVMYGSSILAAHATSYGSHQCYVENLQHGTLNQFGTGTYGGQFHPWRRAFSISLPSDAAVSISSYFLHKKHHELLAVVLPSGSAGMQVGIAGLLYGEGCI